MTIIHLDRIADLPAASSYWYVATVFTSHRQGIDRAYIEALSASTALSDLGIKNFTPIAWSEQICAVTGLERLDHDFWMAVDAHYMAKAHGLLIVKMDGWEQSYGIGLEIRNFNEQGKPIYAIRPELICKPCDCGRNSGAGFAACQCRSSQLPRRDADQPGGNRVSVERLPERPTGFWETFGTATP